MQRTGATAPASARPALRAVLTIPVPSGLVRISRSPGCAPPIEQNLFGVDGAGHGEAVFQFVVLDAVGRRSEGRPGLPHLVKAPLEDLAEDPD